MTDKIVNQHIEASLLGSGWAAVHVVEVDDGKGRGTYWDVQQTGIEQYRTREEAVKEAKGWAYSEELTYKE